MTSNGTYYVFDIALDDFWKSVLNYKIEANDDSGNQAETSIASISIPKKASGYTILAAILPVLFLSSWIVFRRREVYH
ncbi:MAG: hypothetical protein H7641_02210 [Candidatus Heimdallarchaeota archaeon]|nr:hypothetical protein [Candidatus Heimdallarchaeota archaeon]MCK4876377.1 hypothetical protein [Candidatus Heimdallarchaeota archaeon]